MHKGGILDVEFGYRKINSHANMEYQYTNGGISGVEWGYSPLAAPADMLV